MNVSTIAAISTPAGQGGIGVIRLSGPRAIPVALSIFSPKKPRPSDGAYLIDPIPDFNPESRRVYYGHIIDPATARLLDEVLFFVMRSPCSYTAEDTAEIHTHAGPVVMQRVLELLVNAGARLAEPGEFTRRAFLNERIDLTQAEAVADIINARCEMALDMAMAHMSGQMKVIVDRIKNNLFDILVRMEAAIDFPDDVGDIDRPDDIADALDPGILSELDSLVNAFSETNFLRDGLKISIIGPPNVGKSSLFNRLLDRDRAIISDIPGTTRDFIEDSLVMGGIPVILTDTAGIRDNPDPVERIGIEKAWQTIFASDMVLFMMDAGHPVTATDLDCFSKLTGKKTILVINKMDLPDSEIRFRMPHQWATIPCSRISALCNLGINELKERIAAMAAGALPDRQHRVIPNLRQKKLLETTMSAVADAAKGLRENHLFELACIDLKRAIDAMEEVGGENIRPDVLDDIFSRFCIGK